MPDYEWFPNALKICASCGKKIPKGDGKYFEDDEQGHFPDLIGWYHKRCYPTTE